MYIGQSLVKTDHCEMTMLSQQQQPAILEILTRFMISSHEIGAASNISWILPPSSNVPASQHWGLQDLLRAPETKYLYIGQHFVQMYHCEKAKLRSLQQPVILENLVMFVNSSHKIGMATWHEFHPS